MKRTSEKEIKIIFKKHVVFPNFLKIMRWRRGVKQYQLASKVRVPASIICQIENGRLIPSEKLKFKIAKALHCRSVEEIFPEK